MAFVAKRLDHFDSSDFRGAFQKQSLINDPVDLSVGVPEEKTADYIKEEGIKAIREDKTTYTPANGLKELREKIATKLTNENGVNASEGNVTIVPGLTTGLLLIYLAILDPGDEVIVFDPYYPPYMHLVNVAGATAITVSTLPNFQPNLELLEASITDKTKAVVINSPNNPTGAVYTEETLRKIAGIAEKHNILIISDEIYEHFIYVGKHFSIGSIYSNTITMNGFSKEFAMTGWRLGYIQGPQDIIDAINELQQYIVFSSSSIAQYAAVAALGEQRPKLTDKYNEKRNFLIHTLEKLGFEVAGAQGSFYIFLKAPKDLTDIEFADRATEHKLIVVPGRAFSNLHGYIRISYGTDMETIQRGMDALSKIMSDMNDE